MFRCTFALSQVLLPLLILTLAISASCNSVVANDSPITNHNLSKPTQPNVIFILTDDLGWGDLGVFYQNQSKHDRTHKTPMLDQMAAEGMQMRAHYCPAPVCAPSRSSLLTGVHQGHAVIRNSQFDKMLEDNHTLATVMKTAGYRTALIGKYGLQGNGKDAATWPAFPTKRGFDEFFGYVRHVDGHVHYPADHWPLGDSEKHQTPKEVWHNGREVSVNLKKCYTTDLFTAYSKHWIKNHVNEKPDQPFFLYLAYDTPHAALQVPTSAYPEGRGVDGGLQWTGKPDAMINTARGEIDSWRHPDYTGKGWSDQEERFATMVRRIDNGVGDLLQTLQDLEIADNTMVVFTSDNGPHHESYLQKEVDGKQVNVRYEASSFKSYGIYDGTKRDTWEGGIRMPTLAWWPGKIKSGSIDNHPSQFHDWMSTMAEVAGVPAPARCDGVSLVPTLTANGKQNQSTVYVEYNHHAKTNNYEDFEESRRGRKRGEMQVVFMDGFKGIRTAVKSHADPFEIFDVTNDPKESNNLAETSEQFKRLQSRMHDRVLQLRRPNESAKRPYDSEFVAASQPATMGQIENGLNWQVFDGPFFWVPSTENLTASSDGNSNDFTNGESQMESSEAIEVTGFIKVPKEGVYTFEIKHHQGAFMRIHDCAVIDADYQRGSENSRGTIRLAAGHHPIKLTGFVDSESESAGMKVLWSEGDNRAEEIPADALFRNVK